MKKIFAFALITLATLSVAYSQNFGTSGLKPGQRVDYPQKAMAAYFITESTSQTLISGYGVSCAGAGLHTSNSYMRVFDLVNDFGINLPITISSVDFGVDDAYSPSGSQPATVNLYTLTGPFTFANLTLLGSVSTDVLNQSLGMISLPVTVAVPAGSVLVMEVYIPDGMAAGNVYYPGANNLGQTGPSYIAAMECGITEPIDLAVIGFPDSHFVMNIHADASGTVPLSPWAIGIGLMLMTAFVIYRFRR
jgi:hypothetical protein